MAHVRVQRFSTRDGQHHGAKQNEGGLSVRDEEADAVPWIGGSQDLGRPHYLAESKCPNRDEPDDHDRPEYSPYLGGAVLLEEEKSRQDRHRQRDDDMLG